METCPFQIGSSRCQHPFGHLGLHEAESRLGRNLAVQMLWADEWPSLSAEAAIHLAGNASVVPEA